MLLSLLAVALALATPSACTCTDPLLVSSPNFAVRGSWATNVTSPVREFLGIPYAELPTGEHRFRPPVTKKPYQDVLDATSYGPVCMQYGTGAPSAFSEYLPGFGVSTDADEDCLTLNIWAPPPSDPSEGGDGELLPVMIWIPGGALVSGGSSVPYTHGARFAAEHDIVVVTINYRVNIFGFPGAAGLDGHNLNPGLLDQRKAVEYIYQVIAHFGGDPSRITLFGQSAGGSSTDFFSYAWASDPLVSGLIIQSGAVGNNQFAMNRTDNFTYVADLVGCSSGLDKDAELACMQGVDATSIMEAYVGAAGDGVAFGAMADDETIFANWTERRERGLIARLPTLLGATSNEYASLYPYDGTPPNQTELDALSNEFFWCRSAISSRDRRSLGIPTWRYRYEGVWPNLNPAPLPWLGAYHASEIPLVFGTSDLYNGANTAEEAQLSAHMGNVWAAFARDPTGGLTEFGWPLYEEHEETLVVLGEDGSAEPRFALGDAFDGVCVPGVG